MCLIDIGKKSHVISLQNQCYFIILLTNGDLKSIVFNTLDNLSLFLYNPILMCYSFNDV